MYLIESSINFLKDRFCPICPECVGSMTVVKENGISKELPPEYLEEYLGRERNGRDEPTVFINILSHASLRSTGNDKENQLSTLRNRSPSVLGYALRPLLCS